MKSETTTDPNLKTCSKTTAGHALFTTNPVAGEAMQAAADAAASGMVSVVGRTWESLRYLLLVGVRLCKLLWYVDSHVF